MGTFSMPTGELELRVKPRADVSATLKEEAWMSVMFTDGLTTDELAESVEDWSTKYEVIGARYNGKELDIPKNYHWELRNKKDPSIQFGHYDSFREAHTDMISREHLRKTDKTVLTGGPVLVQD